MERLAYHHGNLREALLDRAADIIAERGVDALSLRELARDLGVSHAAPRRHFADRQALLAELASDGFRRACETMERASEEAGDDPVARYRALGRSFVGFALENRSCFLAANHPSVVAEGREELREARQAWFAMLTEGAAAARADGWHPDADLKSLVAFSIAGALGLATMLSDSTWRNTLGTDNLDALADQVLDLIVSRRSS